MGAGVVTILAAIFALEGGYVNDPADPGGATNHGITIAVARKHGYTGAMRDLPRWCPDALNRMIADAEAGRPVRMAKPCADTILFIDYLERPKLLPLVAIDAAVAEEVADTTTNMGPARPARYFQRAVNATCGTTIKVDGQIGPATTAAWAQCREQLGRPACVLMLNSLDAQQRAEYDRLVRVNPSLRRFYRGWIKHRIGNVNRSRCA
jgi:lysozyme family protein